MNTQPFLRGFKHLKIPIIDESGTPAWPELFPISKIDEIRDTVGPRHFSAQMLLEYIPNDQIRLNPDSVHFYNDEFNKRNAKINEYLITGVATYWDPSSGSAGGDGSVCAVVFRDDKTRCAFVHIVAYFTTHEDDAHPMATQCQMVLDLMRAHNLKHIAIEVNGIGNTLPEILRDVAARRGQPIFVQKLVNHENKTKRILDAIEPLLGTGRLFMHTYVQQTNLISEMTDWTPNGSNHDDGLDAIAGALRLNPIPIRPIGQKFKELKANTDFKI